MFRILWAIVGFIPLGFTRRGSRNRIWRNRRGRRVVFLGDVAANLIDATYVSVFRPPRDAYLVHDKYGRFIGTISPPPRRDRDTEE